MDWRTWVLFMGLLWICPERSHPCEPKDRICKKLRECWLEKNDHFVVPDKFNGVIRTENYSKNNGCVIFLQKYEQENSVNLAREWPQMDVLARRLYLSNWHIKNNLEMCVILEPKCNISLFTESACQSGTGSTEGTCNVAFLKAAEKCNEVSYDEQTCKNKTKKNMFIINMASTEIICLNCDNPVKPPPEELPEDILKEHQVTLEINEGQDVDAAQAAEVMNQMSNLATAINDSSASLTLGEGVSGILVRETEVDDIDEVFFGYQAPNESVYVVKNRESLEAFPRSVSLSKEAFEKALSLNITIPFAVLLRFNNMAKDEMNSTLVGNEVLAIDMGKNISNLTDKIKIDFQKLNYEGIPSCRSWNGEGSRPNWTDDGCDTIISGDNITCQCSHLTFFSILLAPHNQTISSSDLKTLTILTQVGCGLSMFFLSIVLFMHCLMRKTKANETTKILIHLVLAMFLLDFTFLINNYVAKQKNTVGCKIMAALMHYFMLVTFTWFVVQAFHLCLQLYQGGKIVISRYVLKVSIVSWVLPSIVGIVLLSIGKYGEQTIHTSDTEESVGMCWITDSDVHNIVNIGYYVLVFLFTFTTFIVIVAWLIHLKGRKARVGKDLTSIGTILGLCCILGITWGSAFFAYGVLQIPAYYVFTVLNSFQGFFLFIYYYNSRHSDGIKDGKNGDDSSSSSTLKTGIDTSKSPYAQT